MAIRLLRSSTANKRPVTTSLVDGQLALNYESTSPGLFFVDSGGALVKVGPVHVGTTAPNSSPAGSSGNATGEIWLDTSGGTYNIKVWDGSAWQTTDALTSADIGVTVQGYDADTAKTDVAQIFTAGQRGEITVLTSGATITPDFDDSNNFSLTLDTTATLANPSNLTAGQSGCIWVTQDGTGSRLLSYDTYWDFTGGTAPTLSTAAGAVDCIVYAVQSSTNITATLITNLS
jgi:hypothetical protein